MNRGLLGYYERELQHIRGVANEFGREFPKIAGRLCLDEFECQDPYVERLLEGFAYLAARVQMKYDAEFPRLTQSILSTIYPHFLAPTPSMMVVQFQPTITDGELADGFAVPRGEALQSIVGKDDRTPCQYRTAHDVTLWPLEIVEAEYITRELAALDLPESLHAKAGLRIRLRTGGEIKFSELSLDELTVFIRGGGELPIRLYEAVFAHTRHVVVQPTIKPIAWHEKLGASCVTRVGYEDDEALLPVGARSFQGYRLLHEYFACPDRFLFFRLRGLKRAMQRCEGNQLDFVLLFDEADLELEHRVDTTNVALFCTPAINLFPKRADRIHLSDRFSEFHVMPDRTRPRDFEVYQVTDVTGLGARADDMQIFEPFYASSDFDAGESGGAYFMLNRRPRLQSSSEKIHGRRSSYRDSEVFVSLVDSRALPYRSDLRQVAIKTLCTNRDLPRLMPIGRGTTDFTPETGGPVSAIKCMAGPTSPQPAYMEGEVAWRAISHLALNYLSITDTAGGDGASALRDLLKLYADAHDPQTRKQIDGVVAVGSRPVTRRLLTDGPLAFVRGLEVSVTLDEKEFEGVGAFLLGAVLERFFAKYVSINSFTETLIKTKTRGEVMRWPTQPGQRHIL